MRYILKDGYIDELSFEANIECKDLTCIEYTGSIPDGYDNLEDWAIEETYEGRLNAWKIVDGNLVYDPIRYAENTERCDKEAAVNASATIGYVDDSIKNAITASSTSETLPTKEISGMVVATEDANNSKIPYINMRKAHLGSITGSFNLYIQGKNILPITAIDMEIEGIRYIFNTDKSIMLDGTATGNSEFSLCGNSTSTDVLFVLKKNTTYHINCGKTITLYSYDGTNRTQIYNGTGETIELDEEAKVTQVTITIPSGTTIDEETIYPQIELGDTFTVYEKPKDTVKIPINLGDNELIRVGLYPGTSLFPSKNLYPSKAVVDTIVIEDEEMKLNKESGSIELNLETIPGTNYKTNTIYTDNDDIYLYIKYTRNSYYDSSTGTNKLHLTSSFESLGSINRLEISGFTSTSRIINVVSSKNGIEEDYITQIDLYDTPDEILGFVYENGVLTITEKVTYVTEQGISMQEITNVTFDDIYFKTFNDNTYIYVKDMDDLIYSCDYMIKSTFTDYFCTREEKNASIKVLEDNIELKVAEKIGFDEIIASLNVAVEDGQGIVALKGNAVTIESDHFNLTADGHVTAEAGNIAGLIMSRNNNGNSFLYKEYTKDSITYQSGLYIPNTTTGNTPFIYAGCETGDHLSNSNLTIGHDGLVKAKWLTVNGESGYFYINYDSNRQALGLNKDALYWRLDDENNGLWFSIVKAQDGSMQAMELYDTPMLRIQDSVHRLVLVDIIKQDNAGNGSQFNSYTNFFRTYNDNFYCESKQNIVFDGNNFVVDANDGPIYFDCKGTFQVNGCPIVQSIEGPYKATRLWRSSATSIGITVANGTSATTLENKYITCSTSDKQFKKDIAPTKVESALDYINKINHYEFKWKENDEYQDLGYIANYLEETNKNFVMRVPQEEGQEDILQVDTFKMMPYITKSIQELSQENKELKEKVNNLESRLQAIEEMLKGEKLNG